jgi:hypothetical protein
MGLIRRFYDLRSRLHSGAKIVLNEDGKAKKSEISVSIWNYLKP